MLYRTYLKHMYGCSLGGIVPGSALFLMERSIHSEVLDYAIGEGYSMRNRI